MDIRLINPFINAVFNTWETMLGVMPERDAPYVKDDALAVGDVSGLIGIAVDNLHGMVALGFPVDTALMIYTLLVGEVKTKITKEVGDAVGELTNIVAGGAKQELSQSGLSYHLSIPTIVTGAKHTLRSQTDSPIVVVPFRMGDQSFQLEVSLKLSKSVSNKIK